MKTILTAMLAAILFSPLTHATTAGPCDTPEHKQFNFWLGKWKVTTPNGAIAGENHIQSEYGGCVVHERYSTPKGYQGESLNIYDASRGVWHQTWVDNGGLLLKLEGKFIDNTMVLEGKVKGQDGKFASHKITWSQSNDGTVRQHWQTSTDGKNWQTAFDGLYTKMKK